MHGTDEDMPDSGRPTVEMSAPLEMAVFYDREDDEGDGPPTEKRRTSEVEGTT